MSKLAVYVKVALCYKRDFYEKLRCVLRLGVFEKKSSTEIYVVAEGLATRKSSPEEISSVAGRREAPCEATKTCSV